MNLDNLCPPYGAILADPPWSFNSWSDKGKNRPPDAMVRQKGLVERHYKTMDMDEIAALPVGELAAKDCALFCWACWPTITDALAIIEGWGFTFKTMGFVWVKGEGLPLFPDDIKDQMGLGYWTRANSEPCILATRGKPKRQAADVRQTILSRRREHSRKPDCQYERIERLVAGPYLEMFARNRRKGWDSWGNEIGKFGDAA